MELNKEQLEQELSQEYETECNCGEDMASDFFIYPVLSLDGTEVEGLPIDKKEYEKGIKEISKTLAIINALKSFGMDNDNIMTYILNSETMAYNERLNKDNNKSNIEIAKAQKMVVENSQL